MRRVLKMIAVLAVVSVAFWLLAPPAWMEPLPRVQLPASVGPAIETAETSRAAARGWLERQDLPATISTAFGAASKDEKGKPPGEAKAPADAKAKSGRPAQPPAPVTATAVKLIDMPVILSAPGTVEPRATVTVKPRVDGQITQVLFKEGDLVKEGQILFRLDDRLVKAQIAQAEANIKKDEANLADAQATFNRRTVLVEKKITSESSMDTARAAMEALKASINAGKAALEAQKTQLDYLVIPAPLTGRTGNTPFKPGANIRAADTTPLVIINQTQPVAIAFALPQTDVVALRGALQQKSKALVTIPGPKPETREATLEFLDNQIDKQTGTLLAKVIAPNLDELLWPGLAVQVALTVEVRRDTLAVPVSAVVPSQAGMLVWVIGADQKVSPKPVTLLRVVEQTAFLADGVKAGDLVVTDGHGRIAPGFNVKVQEAAPLSAPPPAKSPPAAEAPPAAATMPAKKGDKGQRRS